MNNKLQRYLRRTNDNTVGVAEDLEEVTVFVKRKMPMAELQLKVADKSQKQWRKKDVVGETIKTGLFTKKPAKVIEIGHVKAEITDRNEYRPIKGGCEIQPLGAKHVGTAGAIIKYYSWNDKALVGWKRGFVALLERLGMPVTIKRGIITNAHVANKDVNKLELGTWINQPYEGGTVGTVILNLPLGPYFDTSITDLHEEYEETIIGVGKPRKHRRPVNKEPVHKYGRTTRYTQGNVLYQGASIQVDYGEAGIKTIKNCVILSNMSEGGDSGSVIVAMSDQAAVALLFAGSDKATIAIPISDCLREAGVWL